MFWNRKFLSGSDEATGPRGHRAYAIGDIHGRLDLLDELLGTIEADNRSRPRAKTTIVFLGDLIDRGPESAQVVERLRLYRPDFARTVFLTGNHEEVLLRLLAGESSLLASWMMFGGTECARSYGIDSDALRRASPDEAVEMLRRAVPTEHTKFLGGFVDSAAFGQYLFVHAGIRPGVPLADQSKSDLRWIRHPFLEDESDHGHVVVHGHTICEEVEIRPNRIGVDTGAFHTGVLTALGIELSDRWLLQTGQGNDPDRGQIAKAEEAF